jgi:hypothetical protein
MSIRPWTTWVTNGVKDESVNDKHVRNCRYNNKRITILRRQLCVPCTIILVRVMVPQQQQRSLGSVIIEFGCQRFRIDATNKKPRHRRPTAHARRLCDYAPRQCHARILIVRDRVVSCWRTVQEILSKSDPWPFLTSMNPIQLWLFLIKYSLPQRSS